MSMTEFQLFQEQQHSNWVRLRTLTTLRWCAIGGQSVAIIVATLVYGLQIEVWLAGLVVAVPMIANLIVHFTYPENKRLSEREAAQWMFFDLIQLGLLLFVTGGLNNPFAMLVLAPVTVAATVLHRSSTIVLGVTAIIVISLISQFHLPLVMANGASLVLPAIFRFGFWISLVIGVIFLSIYARQVTTEMHAMREALVATQLALAREQKLTDLGGVVAAAAHELGTPLATIKLASSELMEELTDQPELFADANLIREQANRCRDILQSMGRAGKDDLHLRFAPLETVVREAAEPHASRGKFVQFRIDRNIEHQQSQPAMARRPEIIHGLRNLIQNAVDFAQEQVNVDLSWSDTAITVRIMDDGPGFPASVFGRIGDPYVRQRRSTEEGDPRPGYTGMGLGLFIAKTLLERSGASLKFANSRDGGPGQGGAVIDVTWARSDHPDRAPLGENQRHGPAA